MTDHDRGTRSSFGRVPVSKCRRRTTGLGGPSLGKVWYRIYGDMGRVSPDV
jgi:hypothetical protein